MARPKKRPVEQALTPREILREIQMLESCVRYGLDPDTLKARSFNRAAVVREIRGGYAELGIPVEDQPPWLSGLQEPHGGSSEP